MGAIQNIFQKISGGDLGFGIGGSSVAPNYLQALGIIFFLFLLLLVLAKMVRGYMSWYAMGWYIWVFLGFSLALVIEGLFIVNGSTILTEVLGWKSAPKPLQVALDKGKDRLEQVLGESDTAIGETQGVNELLKIYESLNSKEKDKVNNLICIP